MKKLFGTFLLSAALLSGCSSMRYADVDESPAQPQEGNATITFYRDDLNLDDKALTSVPVLLEKKNFEFEPVGILNAGYKVRMELPPGKYSFFTGLKNPTRLNAELAADKHYYVRLETTVKMTRFGEDFLSNPSFDLIPMVWGDQDKDVVRRIKSCIPVKMNDEARQWVETHAQELQTRLMNSYRVYSEGGAFGLKPIPRIKPEDGVDNLL